MANRIPRRRFLQTAPLAALGSPATPADRNPGDALRIGCLNVGSYSHLAIWAPLINPRKGSKDAPLTGMRITHCWDIEPERSEEFARQYGCQSVSNFDDMLGKVDGIVSGGFYNYPWNHVLHQPYLEAGLPNLINRPFAGSLSVARRMLDTARGHLAAILAPSSFEYTEAIARAKAWAAGKKIVCYAATNSFDDYPTHGVHGVYLVAKAVAEAGNPVVSVAYQAKTWYAPPGVMTFEHVDPSGRAFLGSLHHVAGSWGTIQIHTPEEYGGRGFAIQTGSGYPFDKTEVWAPTLWVFENMARYGAMPQTYDQIYEKTRMFFAGFRSILSNGGRPVRLTEVPDDWQTPVDLPTHPGDHIAGLFRKKFGNPRA